MSVPATTVEQFLPVTGHIRATVERTRSTVVQFLPVAGRIRATVAVRRGRHTRR